MTFEILNKVIKEYDIPKDVKLMSDSGWECDATDMDGIWYNRKENILVFTQDGCQYDYHYFKEPNWECVYGQEKDFKEKNGYSMYFCSRDDCVSSVDGLCYRSDRETCKYFDY